MFRIAIAGSPGSGKSTLARQLVNQLDTQDSNAQLITEFARDHINKSCSEQKGKFKLTLADQFLIFNNQIEREDIIPNEVEFMVTDSPCFLPIIFACNICDKSSYQERTIFFNIYNSFFKRPFYDLIIFLERESLLKKDGTRFESAQEADRIGQQIKSFLNLHNINYHEVRGSREERIKKSISLIKSTEKAKDKFKNTTNLFGSLTIDVDEFMR